MALPLPRIIIDTKRYNGALPGYSPFPRHAERDLSGTAKISKTPSSERRRHPRSAPGFASRKGQKLSIGLTKAELVQKYHHKVRIAAAQIAKKFTHSIEVDDLISMGFIGLMDAADKFDPSRGVKFETYAEYRIRGSIFDELRKQDWVPRSARDRAKELQKAVAEIEFKKGRGATDREVSRELGVSLGRYQEMKRDLGNLALVNYESLETLAEKEDSALARSEDLMTEVSRKDAKAILDRLFMKLLEEERIVLSCYYYRGLNLREIGAILSVGESRVCQIHTKAILKLKKELLSQVPSVESLFLILLES